jgi:hypothetical protein
MASNTAARATTLVLVGLATAAGLVFSRALVHRPEAEHRIPPSPAAVEHLRAAVVDPDFTPARSREVRAALTRAFGPAVEPVREDGLVGDFNGDGAPDLAVEVRPAVGHVADVNGELANWTIQDATPPSAPPGHPRVRPVIADGERVLAIVHGYGAQGWRDPLARQAYLVKNVGAPTATPPRGAYPELKRGGTEAAGEVLASTSPAPGILYWAGARYAWRAGKNKDRQEGPAVPQ